MYDYDNTKRNFFQVNFENYNVFNNYGSVINNFVSSGEKEKKKKTKKKKKKSKKSNESESGSEFGSLKEIRINGMLLLEDKSINMNFDERREEVVLDEKPLELSVEPVEKEKKVNRNLAEDEEDINDFRNKFLPSKLKTLKLEKIYRHLGNFYGVDKYFSKAEALHNCGTWLRFEVNRNDSINNKKLKRINSCKLRLCPYCAWRKSLKIFANLFRCYQKIQEQDENKDSNDKSRFLFLTVTTSNVEGKDLSKAVDDILKAFDKFRRYKNIKDAFEGWVRSLEIVVDREPRITSRMFNRAKDYYKKRNLEIGSDNPNYLKYNLHIHILIHTRFERYKKFYINQEEYTTLWQNAVNCNYKPIVYIEPFRARSSGTKGRELAELAKYTVKAADYMRFDDEEINKGIFLLDAEIILCLEKALHSRRLLGLGGSFRKISKELKLDYENFDDEEDYSEAENIIINYYFDFFKSYYIRFG